MLRLSLAWIHLVALAIGFAAVVMRAAALRRRPLDARAVRSALAADAWWGLAALLWLATGVWRWLAGTEKLPSYYLQNAAFHAKLGLFTLILLLELWPMTTLIKWRRAMGRAGGSWAPPERDANRIARVSIAEAMLVLAIALAATLVSRGYGAFGAAAG